MFKNCIRRNSNGEYEYVYNDVEFLGELVIEDETIWGYVRITPSIVSIIEEQLPIPFEDLVNPAVCVTYFPKNKSILMSVHYFILTNVYDEKYTELKLDDKLKAYFLTEMNQFCVNTENHTLDEYYNKHHIDDCVYTSENGVSASICLDQITIQQIQTILNWCSEHESAVNDLKRHSIDIDYLVDTFYTESRKSHMITYQVEGEYAKDILFASKDLQECIDYIKSKEEAAYEAYLDYCAKCAETYEPVAEYYPTYFITVEDKSYNITNINQLEK